jgi:hypothetical protein
MHKLLRLFCNQQETLVFSTDVRALCLSFLCDSILIVMILTVHFFQYVMTESCECKNKVVEDYKLRQRVLDARTKENDAVVAQIPWMRQKTSSTKLSESQFYSSCLVSPSAPLKSKKLNLFYILNDTFPFFLPKRYSTRIKNQPSSNHAKQYQVPHHGLFEYPEELQKWPLLDQCLKLFPQQLRTRIRIFQAIGRRVEKSQAEFHESQPRGKLPTAERAI